ncbi:MAG: hypothetical protein QNJ92_06920 [Alphaproteobacteria bacterium]|nr:hypothetical protein [Alphaproteobacteria bacterium]
MTEKAAPSRPSAAEREGPPKAKAKKSHKAEGDLARGARDAQQTDLARCNELARAAAADRAERARKKKEFEDKAIAKAFGEGA